MNIKKMKGYIQKQQFADVLQNKCSQKLRNIHNKTPVFEPLFNKIGSLKDCSFVEKRLQHHAIQAPKTSEVFAFCLVKKKNSFDLQIFSRTDKSMIKL